MTEIELNLTDLRQKAEAATPQNFDSAEIKESGDVVECPFCGGEGEVDVAADYCNYDGVALGVQFYGVGKQFVAAEEYYRAANPAVILSLLDRLERAEAENATLREALDKAMTINTPQDLDESRTFAMFPDAENLDNGAATRLRAHDERLGIPTEALLAVIRGEAVIVPVEPTENMTESASRVDNDASLDGHTNANFYNHWDAMICARPWRKP